ncbi:hypothetical protein I5907_15725 [Panacibacter sp. DH6]|uniref:Uncharacterized protein n=1 Tax=Panacibacter microcysteis TaxID=2793269 RepID=A0A931E984_9BACT|nr:hypothetical protein [Panacibacter microcysteis]MBG9377691.1 hypothetical protein [Panacibacter microcysteis]
MKKNLKIILIVFALSLLGFSITYKFGLATKYNYFSAKRDISNGNIQIISYGLPLIDEILISKSFAFQVEEFGCSISNEQINGIEKYNKIVKEYFTKINGDNWGTQFNNKCDSLIKLISQPNY